MKLDDAQPPVERDINRNTRENIARAKAAIEKAAEYDLARNTPQNIARRKEENERRARKAWAVVGGLVALALIAWIIWSGTVRPGERDEQKLVAATEGKIPPQQPSDEGTSSVVPLHIASDDQLRALIADCKREIEQTAYSEPFAVYFPDYSPAQLRTMTDAATAFGMDLGRPSVALDGFDADEYNFKRIRDGAYTAEFVIESAFDSFSGPIRYVAVYSCEFRGEAGMVVHRRQFHPMNQ